MQSGFLHYKQSVIHYIKIGEGDRLVVCFHGYGETADKFNFLGRLLKDEVRIIAIDLPIHGETQWNESECKPEDLVEIIYKLVEEESPTSEISLLGFSMGARIALSILEKLRLRIGRIVLLAPDGLKLNFWYWLSTQTWLGNKIFRRVMKNPSPFFFILKIANRAGLINQSIFKFVSYYIHDDEVRKELYDRWTGLKKFRPDLQKIPELINENRIPVRLLYGKFDRIILKTPGLRFIAALQKDAKIIELDCGHQILHERNGDSIALALIN